MTEDENPLIILGELEKLLEDKLPPDRPAWESLKALRASLREKGYEEPSSEDSYTQKRARSLLALSVKLQDTLRTAILPGVSYADRAATLAAVSNSYLKLAHAFKVDSKVWNFAQNDLVPILSAAVDEKSIDEGVSRLLHHLDRYLKSLRKWLQK